MLKHKSARTHVSDFKHSKTPSYIPLFKTKKIHSIRHCTFFSKWVAMFYVFNKSAAYVGGLKIDSRKFFGRRRTKICNLGSTLYRERTCNNIQYIDRLRRARWRMDGGLLGCINHFRAAKLACSYEQLVSLSVPPLCRRLTLSTVGASRSVARHCT